MAFHHLLVYLCWTDRAPAGGPEPTAHQTTISLGVHGFPAKVGEAFLQNADTLKSVILTRLPGKAATGLIDDGYCLKSFSVHAKSCNRGPMAGGADRTAFMESLLLEEGRPERGKAAGPGRTGPGLGLVGQSHRRVERIQPAFFSGSVRRAAGNPVGTGTQEPTR